MITKRIIPCLDVKDGRVVKGVNFLGLADVSSPVKLAQFYSENGADELVFYDITASSDGRKLFTEILTEVASKIFIPLTVGGGINTLDDFDRVLKCGADKVSVNSGAIKNPDLIGEAAKKYGVTLAIEPHGTFSLTGEGLKRIMALGDPSVLGINYDACNIFRAGYVESGNNKSGYKTSGNGENEVEVLKTISDRVVHCHAKDIN